MWCIFISAPPDQNGIESSRSGSLFVAGLGALGCSFRLRFCRSVSAMLCVAALSDTGCGVSLRSRNAVEISADEARVKAILRAVFPDLSEEELSEYSSKAGSEWRG